MRTSMPGCASWNAAMRVTSHFAASDAVVLTTSNSSRPGRCSRAVAWRRSSNAARTDGQVALRLARQRQAAIAPLEQAEAELLLQPADLMADRGLRHVQLGGGEGEAEVARRRLERAQSVERGKRRHAASLYMTLPHVKPDKPSFVRRCVPAPMFSRTQP